MLIQNDKVAGIGVYTIYISVRVVGVSGNGLFFRLVYFDGGA